MEVSLPRFNERFKTKLCLGYNKLSRYLLNIKKTRKQRKKQGWKQAVALEHKWASRGIFLSSVLEKYFTKEDIEVRN